MLPTLARMIVTDSRPVTFRDVFAVAEFRVLFGSYSVFMIGETVKMLALSVLIYERTGSGLLAALAYVTGFLPHAVGGVFLLALADRWPPRLLIVGYDLFRLATVVVLALGVLSPAAMLGLVAVVGLLAPVSSAARSALLPEVLQGDAYVLGRSVLTIAAGGTQVAGFALGGLLLGLVGPYGALWLTAATCLLAALLARVGLAPRAPRVGGATGSAVTGNAIGETWRVNRALLADRRVRGLLLAQWIPGSLLVGAEGVAVPYAAGLDAEASAGILLMAAAFGMLVGDLLVGRFVAPARREALTPWLALLLGVPMLAFVTRPGLWSAAALLTIATAGFSYQLGLARRFLDAVPESRRGQAFGLLGTGLMAVQGLAAAAGGALTELVTPGIVMALAGVASLAATVTLWRILAPPPATVEAGILP
ncbi:major facilitator superfamily MFS_1 [Salinispora tropica CNB-440]|uniref:Major facilitator superfamily MFS_1 n=2 Tax=Salinispora tropica TaxID=168695 RepID=A4XCL8_SALTO|nr:major facilitator superfamily MFS_1 [Salinispora tropica CNB-440]